jgi:hypothetical protein
MTTESVVDSYLDLLDGQREAAFAALEGLADGQIWQRPAPKEWSIGEILDHTYLVQKSLLPFTRLAWRFLRWVGELRKPRPYQTTARDVYRTGRFPMWVGFLWTPRHTPREPVPLDELKREIRSMHADVRTFYAGKDEGVLGHVHVFDPLVGCPNLIQSLRIGIFHDQLHYDDVLALARTRGG